MVGWMTLVERASSPFLRFFYWCRIQTRNGQEARSTKSVYINRSIACETFFTGINSIPLILANFADPEAGTIAWV